MDPVTRSSQGNEYAVVMTRNIQARKIAKFLLKFVCRQGIPDQIMSDQGTNYQSTMLSEL